MKKLLQYPVTVLFFLFLFGFSLTNFLTPSKAFSELENKYLAQRPAFSWKALLDSSDKGFAQKFEKYVNEQFPLRDGWISLKSRAESALGKIENNGIVYGRDGYLFDKYRGYDAGRLEKNLGLLERFAEKTSGLDRTLMVIPASYNLMTDRLPEGLGNIDQIREIEAVYERARQSGYRTVDAAAALMAHVQEEIYYRTDHHWTTDGAWYGYEAFAAAVGRQAVRPDSALRRTSEGFWGTYFSKAKKYNAAPDTLVWYDLPVDSVTIDGSEADGMYDLSQLEKRDRYAMFLHANNGVTVLQNSGAPEGSILVIKDSYANCFVPFLTQSYSKVVVVDLRSMPKSLAELIHSEKIEEILVLYSFENLASDSNFPRLLY
ncbi:DHHW family protein [Faecalicatena sp. BF-R-105]|nr:DHHW family protein [Faecalicatena sp. BF-R-105]